MHLIVSKEMMEDIIYIIVFQVKVLLMDIRFLLELQSAIILMDHLSF